MIPLSQQPYDMLYHMLAYGDPSNTDLKAVESEIETREVLNFDTHHWLAGDDYSKTHPQALIS